MTSKSNRSTTIKESFDVVETPTRKSKSINLDAITKDEDESDTVTTNKKTIGVVSGCTVLNVRSKASATSEVASSIQVGSEVVIDEANSTEEFYKVGISAGVEGYCMRKYITIL